MSKEKEISLFPKQGKCVISKFLKKEVRKTFHNNEWWFCIVDMVEALVETDRASAYWSDIKTKMEEKEGITSFDFFERLKIPRKDGSPYPMDCSNIEGNF